MSPVERSSGGGGGGSPLTVTDGTHSVTPVSTVDFTSGATVSDAGGGQANVSISASAGNLAAAKVFSTSGDVTTTSTTFVDLTNATLTITTGARRVLLAFSALAQNNTITSNCFDLVIDGTRLGGTFGMIDFTTPSSGFTFNPSFTFLTDVLTAASHTFKIQWRVAAGTGTVFQSAIGPMQFSAVELYAA